MRRKPKMIDCVCGHCGIAYKALAWRVKNGEGKHCTNACYHASKSLSSPARFWAHCTQREGGCLEWNGVPMQTGGYGRLRVNGLPIKAHRHAYTIAHGPIPAGAMVIHSCDNPICVNPDHLRAGSAHDNMRDMSDRGRSAGSGRLGELHPMAKITDAQADEIRRRYARRAPGTQSNTSALCAEYGVGAGTIYAVVHGRRKRRPS